MTVKTIYRNAQGELINIGPWDFGFVMNQDTGEQIVTNPLPDGAYQDTADVVEGWDGGLYLADDPRRNGPGA